MIDKKAFLELAEKVTGGSATDNELQLYNSYLNQLKGSGVWDEGTMGNEEGTKNELQLLINHKIDKPKPSVVHTFRLWYKTTAVAAVLIVLSTGIWFYTKKVPHSNKKEIAFAITEANDISPGGNKAELILADGKSIDLSKAINGILAEHMGTKIIKVADGQLLYETDKSASTISFDKDALNTIIIPRGGTYQITLQDGTKVWLNAASSLKYPATFASLKERKVELTGEAYFEVTKTSVQATKIKNGYRKPFLVVCNKQQVEVLGTHFNINSYADEPGIKTTLIEGAVKVSTTVAHNSGTNNAENFNSLILKPGQNSLLTNDYLKVVPGSTTEAIAWQQGKFLFNNEHITSIMRRIARWYDVDAIYPEKMPRDLNFTGSISRNKKLSQILRIMELTRDVQFRINDRKLYIMRTY